jgi:hypothetical protein
MNDEDIAEALGEADAAFTLIAALLEYLIAKKTLSRRESATVIRAALHAVSQMPEATEGERQTAVSMLSTLLDQHGRGQTH